MPQNVGGDVIEITYNNPNVGSGVFFAVSSADSEIDLGGFRNNESKEGITGSGDAIWQMTNRRWSFSVDVANDMNTRQDLENLVALAEDLDETQITIQWINGITYGGSGKPVGDYKLNAKSSVFKLNWEGSGKLAQV
jgi:hypothetical protein